MDNKINEDIINNLSQLNSNNENIRTKSLKEYETFRTNPFLSGIINSGKKKKYETIKQGKYEIIDKKSGEVLEGEKSEFTRIYYVEKEKYVKLYTGELGRFFDLRKSTQHVLKILLTELQEKCIDKDIIYLDYNVVIDFYEGQQEKTISQASYYNSMRELLSKSFIAKTKRKNQYFIDPRLFFNGDRFSLVKEYRKKQAEINNPKY